MEMAKVTSKGQITIPVSIRRRLNIDEGDKLLFLDSPDGGVIMVNPNMLQGGVPSQSAAKKSAPKSQAKSGEKAAAKKVSKPEQDDTVAAQQAVEPAAQEPVTQESVAMAEPVVVEPIAAQEPVAAQEPIAQEPVQTDATERKTVSKTLADAQVAVSASDTQPQSPEATDSSEKVNPSHGLDLQALLNEIRSIGSNI